MFGYMKSANNAMRRFSGVIQKLFSLYCRNAMLNTINSTIFGIQFQIMDKSFVDRQVQR